MHTMNYHDNNIYVNEQVLKHVESLRTRLGFARFKLSNGWENNTLGDVECFWKQKQRQSIKDIPIPRFTQQDIIDKRSYIQASGAKYAKARRYRLLSRSYSSPSPKQDMLNFVSSSSSSINKSHKKSRRKSHPPSQQYTSNDEDSSNSSTISSPSQQPPQQPQHHQQQQQQQQNQTYYFHHYDKDAWGNNNKKLSSPTTTTKAPTPIGNHSVSSFDASCVPSDLNGEPSVVKNSLDYLSYAIAMTEKHSDIIEEEPTLLEDDDEDDEDTDLNFREDWTRTSQLRLSLSIPNQPSTEDNSNPSSPATNVAAQAMLMFVNRESTAS